MAAMDAKDLKAKASLAKATASVRNKFHQVRSAHLENKRLLEQQYKPITKRLGELITLKDKKTKASSPPAVKTPSLQRQWLPISTFTDIDGPSDDDMSDGNGDRVDDNTGEPRKISSASSSSSSVIGRTARKIKRKHVLATVKKHHEKVESWLKKIQARAAQRCSFTP